uniref:Late embryogenesis abundant protein LEA-2 subgroup domain-containing protein n=1 Tax=Oryza barthii TaxID=65489 RepID=A0A0D3GH97_9ORYZ
MATACACTTTDGSGDVCLRPSASDGLPTHQACTSKAAPDGETSRCQHQRRRCCVVCLIATIATLVLLGVAVLVLSLTVFRVRDPAARLVSVRVVGVSPNLAPPSPQINVTLLLTVAVHNPNPASFTYSSGGGGGGGGGLTYRGAHVGDAVVEAGRIPSRGDGTVQMEMTVLSSSFTGDFMAELIRDIEAGAVPFDASARIPGKVAVFGVLKLHAVAYSDCHVVFGVPEMGIRSQECHDRATL